MINPIRRGLILFRVCLNQQLIYHEYFKERRKFIINQWSYEYNIIYLIIIFRKVRHNCSLVKWQLRSATIYSRWSRSTHSNRINRIKSHEMHNSNNLSNTSEFELQHIIALLTESCLVARCKRNIISPRSFIDTFLETEKCKRNDPLRTFTLTIRFASPQTARVPRSCRGKERDSNNLSNYNWAYNDEPSRVQYQLFSAFLLLYQ